MVDSSRLLLLSRELRAAASIVVLAMATSACRMPQDSRSPSGSEDELALLEALPYASWGEAEDPSLQGVTLWDPDRASPGVNLYTNDADEAYLMAMDGSRLHTWRLPPGSKHCEYFELLEDGQIIATCQGQWVVRLDRDSSVIWRRPLEVHHDIHVDADGSSVTLVTRHHRYRGRLVNFGEIAFLSAQGEPGRVWRFFPRLEQLRPFHPPSELDEPPTEEEEDSSFDYYHANTIERLPPTPLGQRDERFREGNLLLCLRNVNTLLILDRDTLRPVWSWGGDMLDSPHMPTMLENGNILVFDNGRNRGASRILEIEPQSERIVWRYEPNDPQVFFSDLRGSSQRLPNGNTLICESERGRAFEITPGGEIVWEFWNPEIRRNGERKLVYRLLRLTPEEAAAGMRESRYRSAR